MRQFKRAITTCITWAAEQERNIRVEAFGNFKCSNQNAICKSSETPMALINIEGDRLCADRAFCKQPFAPETSIDSPRKNKNHQKHRPNSLFIHSENHFYCGVSNSEPNQQIVGCWFFVAYKFACFLFQEIILSLVGFQPERTKESRPNNSSRWSVSPENSFHLDLALLRCRLEYKSDWRKRNHWV